MGINIFSWGYHIKLLKIYLTYVNLNSTGLFSGISRSEMTKKREGSMPLSFIKKDKVEV